MPGVATVPRPSRPNRLLVALGAGLAVVGFLVTVVVAGALGTPATPSRRSTTTIVVAARDIAARTTLAAADLDTAAFAAADVPPGAIARAADAAGKVSLVSLKKGQPLFSNLIGGAGDAVGPQPGFLPLPAGTVAATLPSGEQQGVAGYIQAGDYIDIQAITSPKSAAYQVVRTIYSNVYVIRVGPAADLAPGAGTAVPRTGGLSSSITIAVSECQAEYLNWFLANATLRYTLLSFRDYQPPTPDTSCPAAGKGVTDADVRARWPGLL